MTREGRPLRPVSTDMKDPNRGAWLATLTCECKKQMFFACGPTADEATKQATAKWRRYKRRAVPRRCCSRADVCVDWFP